MIETLYLIQHGEAVPEEQDPARPLSPRGRAEVERVARAAARVGVTVSAIRHSGKLRAQQTAEILSAHVHSVSGVSAVVGLGPKDDPAHAVRAIDEGDGALLLVGHLPHLSRLTSLLVAGDPETPIVSFRMGAIVALGREAEGWRLRFILTPEVAGV